MHRSKPCDHWPRWSRKKRCSWGTNRAACSLRTTRLLDADGAVSGVCYQALDITRRKHAEAALLAATSAQLAAEGMARTKSSFLANMSHEIRTPMNAVLGLSRMVLQEDLPPPARDKLAKIHEAARALTRILDDVLDFSKIEAGALRFEHRPFSLYQVLTGVKSLFSANAQEKQLSLALDLPLGVPQMLVGDAFRLSQVLNNLVSNALKFTTTGGVRIGVAPLDAEPDRADACSLRFSVRDTGVGIAPEVRQTLFHAFTQGDATVTRRFGGTGLGLAISQRLVELMQGRIGVNSEVGQGSEFWFSAHFEIAQNVDLPASAAPGAAARPGGPRLRHRPAPGCTCWWPKTTRSTRSSRRRCWRTWGTRSPWSAMVPKRWTRSPPGRPATSVWC
jgi:signal transduction histidine kinase